MVRLILSFPAVLALVSMLTPTGLGTVHARPGGRPAAQASRPRAQAHSRPSNRTHASSARPSMGSAHRPAQGSRPTSSANQHRQNSFANHHRPNKPSLPSTQAKHPPQNGKPQGLVPARPNMPRPPVPGSPTQSGKKPTPKVPVVKKKVIINVFGGNVLGGNALGGNALGGNEVSGPVGFAEPVLPAAYNETYGNAVEVDADDEMPDVPDEEAKVYELYYRDDPEAEWTLYETYSSYRLAVNTASELEGDGNETFIR